jgi:hypothetical protein
MTKKCPVKPTNISNCDTSFLAEILALADLELAEIPAGKTLSPSITTTDEVSSKHSKANNCIASEGIVSRPVLPIR